MAAIHTESAAIFGAKNVNVSEEKVVFVEYKPVNPISPNTVVEFLIPGHGDKYVSLKDSRIECLVEFEIHDKRPSKKPYVPLKPQIPIGYRGDKREILDLSRPARPPVPETGGGGNDKDATTRRRRSAPRRKRFRRDVANNVDPDMIPTEADVIRAPVVNLNQITSPEERQAASDEYEDRVDEWNDFVTSYMAGTYEYMNHGYPIDDIFHTMWNGVDVFLNQQLVSTTNTMYAYKAYIETILNNTISMKKYQLRNQGYTGPECHEEDPILISSDADPYGESEAMQLRKKYFKPNKVYELRGFLSSDMWNINASILNGVEIGIKLYPNKDSFRMMTFPPGIEATLTLRDITLKVCKKRMSPKIILAHTDVLEKHDASYPFTRTEVRSFNVAKGSRSATIENPYQSNIPARLIIGMVRADAKAGMFSRNPLRFQHFDISSAGFYINDEPVPRRPYKLDPGKGIFTEPLIELYTALGNIGKEDLGISHEEYLNGCFLIPFDVQPTAAGDLHYLARRSGGHCRLELLFKEPLPLNICVITYAIFPAILEIDLPRNVRVVDLEKPRRVAALKGSVNKDQAAITNAPV